MRRLLFTFFSPNARSDPNKIPHTLQIATMFLLSPRTRSVTRTTLLLFLLLKDVLSVRDLRLRSHRVGAWKTTYEPAFSPLSALHHTVSSIQRFRNIFTKSRATFGADTLLFQVCHCLDKGELVHSKHLEKSRYCSEILCLISV